MICQSNAFFLRHFSKFHQEISDLYICENCRAAFLYPQPSDQWLNNEYSSYYKKRNITDSKKDYFSRYLKEFNLVTYNKILEVGGGEGSCARQIKLLHPQSELTVIEFNKDCIPFYKDIDCNLIIAPLEKWLQTNHEKYDLVLLFDVLEHFRDPKKILQDIEKHVLNENAKLIATFPNYDALSRKLLHYFWPQFKSEHLFYFSKKSVQEICKKCNLNIELLKPHKKYLSVDYLLNIGANFGPFQFKKIISFIQNLIPTSIKKLKLQLLLGEWNLIAKKNGHSS